MSTWGANSLVDAAETGAPDAPNGLTGVDTATTVSTAGLLKKPQWQRKVLSSDATSDGAISDLTYTLTSGQVYMIFGQIKFSQNTSSDGTVAVIVKDGSTEIGRISSTPIGASGGNFDFYHSFCFAHTMSGTSLTFEADSTSNPDSLIKQTDTFANVIRIPSYEATVT